MFNEILKILYILLISILVAWLFASIWGRELVVFGFLVGLFMSLVQRSPKESRE
jgi:hypothetical protein